MQIWRESEHIRPPLKKNRSDEFAKTTPDGRDLTFALDEVEVELVQGGHRDGLDLVLGQELQHQLRDVFAGRHARRLGDFLLR